MQRNIKIFKADISWFCLSSKLFKQELHHLRYLSLFFEISEILTRKSKLFPSKNL
jgi:hypothetical protein